MGAQGQMEKRTEEDFASLVQSLHDTVDSSTNGPRFDSAEESSRPRSYSRRSSFAEGTALIIVPRTTQQLRDRRVLAVSVLLTTATLSGGLVQGWGPLHNKQCHWDNV